ncbi:hypothetical protein FRC08_007525 [Ceratobasidium sp. 394]|nr:hypothetical protein FRC08_007525 [Ceratobasidium sp. 394]
MTEGARQDLLVEDRVLRSLVLPRCLPLYRVLKPRHFLMASISLIKTICDLYEQGAIMHRDISVNGLMVKAIKPWEGVLIDLDLACDLRTQCQQPASSLHRTGTLPFMALDMLHVDGNYPQYHRHDLEVFVYVLVWIAGRYEAGREINKTLLNRWCEGDWTSISNDKLGFVSLSNPYTFFSPNPSYIFLADPINKYHRLLREAHLDARKDLVANIPRRPAADTKSTQHEETPDKGYALQTEKGQVSIYPKDLTGLNRNGLLLVLEGELLALGPASPDAFTGSD